MAKVKVEVLGVQPPCVRCRITEENARKAALNLAEDGIEVEVVKLDISSRETASRFGVLASPAISINGVVRIMGKVPDPGVIERLIREAL